MVTRTFRTDHALATGTQDTDDTATSPGRVFIPLNSRLVHVSCVAGDISQAPFFAAIRVHIEDRDMFIAEGWVRGYSVRGGGISATLDMDTGTERPWVGFSVRNDSGGDIVWVHQIEVD